MSSIELYIGTTLNFDLDEVVEVIQDETPCDELYTEVVLPLQGYLTHEDSYELIVEVLDRLEQEGDSAQEVYTELFTWYGKDRGWADPGTVSLNK